MLFVPSATRANFCAAKFSSFVAFEQLKRPVIGALRRARARKPAAARSSASSQLAALSSPLSRTSGCGQPGCSAVACLESRPVAPARPAERPASQPVVRRRRTSSSVRAHSCVARVELLRAQVGAARRRAARAATGRRRRARAPRARASRRGAADGCASPGRARPASAIWSRPVAPGSGRGCGRESAHAELVERVERDPPVRRQLAAGDAEHPARRRVVKTVSRRAFAVAPSPPGSTRSPQKVDARARAECRRRRRPPRRAPARCRRRSRATSLGLALVQRVRRAEQQHPLPRVPRS